MSSRVLFVYWALLLISIVSSALLFILVASEGTQVENLSFHPEKNETLRVYDNATINYDNLEENFESTAHILNAKTENTVTFKTEQDDNYHQAEITMVSASFETINSENVQKEKDVDILAEGLTQQPNLSQGLFYAKIWLLQEWNF